MNAVATRVLGLAGSVGLFAGASAIADSSCTAHSSTEGTPRTCSITCDGGKQAVCEEGVAGREPQCRCAQKPSEPGEKKQLPRQPAPAS